MKNIILVGFVLVLAVACFRPTADAPPQPDGRRVDLTWGEAIYRDNCAHCHDTGANGAQILGDVDGWRSRIARGVPQLVSNAINGYSGALGYMPPRGGNPALSHEAVAAATAYIIEQSK